MRFSSFTKKGTSTILRQSDLGVVTWQLDRPIRQDIKKVQRSAEKLLRKHKLDICHAKGGKLVAEVEAGIRVLEMLSTYRPICTTELHVHRALVACYFAAHFLERGTIDAKIIEAIRILAQVAPCSLDPSSTYFAVEIVKRLSSEAGAIYANLAKAMIQEESVKLTLAEALLLYPELSRLGGPKSGPMLGELATVTEACRNALTKLGGNP